MADGLTEALAAGSALGIIMAMGTIMLVVALALYVYSAIALMVIAKKTKTSNGWFAFIPILNIYLITQMAGVSGLWTLIILAGFIPIVGALAMTVAMIWMFWKVAENIDFPGWTSLLMLIPIVNLVMLGVWAWGKA